MSDEVMTDEQYIERGGMACPYCHKTDGVESVGTTEMDNGYAWQEVKCEPCDKLWVDNYKLVGYESRD